MILFQCFVQFVLTLLHQTVSDGFTRSPEMPRFIAPKMSAYITRTYDRGLSMFKSGLYMAGLFCRHAILIEVF